MQFKLAYLSLALATVASATPTSLTARGEGGQCIPAESCSPGPVQCCQTSSVVGVSGVLGPVITSLLTLAGLTAVAPVGTLVGLTCTNVLSGGTW